MITFSIIFFILLIFLFLLIIGYQSYHFIKQIRIFKRGRNPYHRICKKCGAHQVYYTSIYTRYSWWGEIYPIGNNENCECHKYAEDK